MEPFGEWQFKWATQHDTGSTSEERNDPRGWIHASADNPVPENPANYTSAWIKIELPPYRSSAWKQPGLFIDKLYGHKVNIYAGERSIYESERHYSYDVFKIALPLEQQDMGKALYIKIVTYSDRIGLHQNIGIGEYQDELIRFYKTDLFDLILGGSLVFFGAMMLLCSPFLNKSQLARWISLSLVIFTTGTMIVTYSPFPYTFFGSYGKLCLTTFDLSLFVFLPSLALFIEKALDGAKVTVIVYMRKFIVAYSAFCIALLLLNEITGFKYINIYYFFTLTVLGIVMLVQFLLLISVSSLHAVRGNKDAIILSTGFALFAATGIGELIWFYAHAKNYELYLWKWGVLCFVIAFIVILSRRFARDHEQIVNHTKELELYNSRLQRHEKMEILSELAASVAHEVRNPLQVTRGFLQLLRETSEDKPKKYLGFALDELDRASGIITDFLTFAKPQLDDVSVLRLSDEFEHIQGILAPMANIQGGEIRVQIPDDVYISGNSSKLKQAFVNIVKNSIEALENGGTIEIWAYPGNGEIVIHVKDTGGGMDENELSRLGEPYFSSKTKGTGLGLMVTFRIIEVMQGKIEFKSKKGAGTEAIIRFPSAAAPE
ncbi:sensor histidine kinase [Paenibacillus mesophilus]|uniref:sensor histidine kinase n=1 Tax=Paenibacillus mesophilus TaxID=2582849 RepID=UPI001EE4AAED|nr:HAMP domain-containing sensor histidine kinase [Paenibacillus mesophilus]